MKDDKEPSYALPSYLYLDPADAIELAERRAIERAETKAIKHRQLGLLGPNTKRLIKRQRIRELMRRVGGP